MDETKYVELEAKYDASSLPVSDFQAAMATLGGTFKTVVGHDTFFSDTQKVLRYRRGRAGVAPSAVDKPALTYKQRRRDGDISDRTEIDMWLGAAATDQDVRAMMEVLHFEEAFTITKESWIQHVPEMTVPGTFTPVYPNWTSRGVVGVSGAGLVGNFAGVGHYISNSGGHYIGNPPLPADRIDAIFALYDVMHEGHLYRFLEVEMERVGTVSAADATAKLAEWKGWIARAFPKCGEPLNKSLYEMFAPRNRLFVPESF